MDARTPAAGPVDRLQPSGLQAAGRVWLGLLLALFLLGCRADPNMQLAEKELRLQDRRIFDLEEHLADCHSSVAAYRREIASLRRRLEDDGATEPSAEKDAWDLDARLRPDLPSDPSLPAIDEGNEAPAYPQIPPVEEGPSLNNDPAPDFDPTPDFDTDEASPIMPADDDPPAPFPAVPEQGMSLPDTEAGGNSAESHPLPISEELPPPDLTGDAREIEQIRLRLMVRYHAVENTPVELQALIQPQDGKAQQVLAAGDVSLMVVETGDRAERPLARWDFADGEAVDQWRRSRLGTGMQFHLPWPGTPAPGSYRLWARFVGQDGRKHLGTADFEIHEAALARGPELRLPTPAEQPTQHANVPTPAAPRPDSMPEPASTAAATADTPLQQKDVDLAWKPSVEAARLAPPPQNRSGQAETEDLASANAADEGRIPWSPDRPAPTRDMADAKTADRVGNWLPYR